MQPDYHASLPCVVVPVIDSDGVTEAGEGSVQLLRQNKLMAQQRVGVREARVHLRDRQVTQWQTGTNTSKQTGQKERQVSHDTRVLHL